MYVLLDKNKRFTGSYSVSGGCDSEDSKGVLVQSLPPEEDLLKQCFWRWDTHTIQTGANTIPVMLQATDEEGTLLWEDEEKTIPTLIQSTDENGEPKYTEEPIIENVTEWIFDESDQEAYEHWIKSQSQPTQEPTLDERNRADIEYIGMMMGVEL